MDSPLPPDPYQALGLSKTATGDEIRKAYRKLALRVHPDKCIDESLKAQRTDEFHLIQQAYDIIGDEDKRSRYDAQIRMAELRRHNLELRSQSTRTTAAPAYDVRTAAPRDASYATRGSTRAPYEEPRRQRYYEYEAAPRATAKKTSGYDEYLPPKREAPSRDREAERLRAKLDQEAEARRKKEKKRDVEVRESRSTKYDAREIYEEDVRKAETRRPPMTRRDEEYGSFSSSRTSPTQRKTEEWERDAQRHMQERAERSSRPSAYTRTPSYEVRRSSALPKEKERVRESARRSSPGKDERRRNAESMDPYERVMPNLTSHSSSPPVMEQPPQPHRSYNTQSNFDGQRMSREASPPPAIHRATTTPTESSLPPRRKDSTMPSSKLRHTDTISPDSGYSSPAGTPNYATKQSYGYPYPEEKSSASQPRPFKTVIAEPVSSTRRGKSPSPVRAESRPSNTAAKMAGLDPKRYPASSSSARKTTYAYGESATVRPSVSHSASTRDIPIVDRSRRNDRDRRRDREREQDRDYRYSSDEKPRDKLYDERGAGNIRYAQPTSFTTENVSYAPRYDMNDVSFAGSSRPRERVRERDDFVKPSMVRSTTYAY
jgi:curved DNA-binding protein CbpA